MSDKSQEKSVNFHISCPSCNSTFRLPTNSIQAGGRHVKCSVCSHIWIYRARINDLFSDNEKVPSDLGNVSDTAISNTAESKDELKTDISTKFADDAVSELSNNKKAGADELLKDDLTGFDARTKANSELESIVSIMESIKGDINSTSTDKSKVAVISDQINKNDDEPTAETNPDEQVIMSHNEELGQNETQQKINSIFDDKDFINNIISGISTKEQSNPNDNKPSHLLNLELNKNLNTSKNIGDPIAEVVSDNSRTFDQVIPKEDKKNLLAKEKPVADTLESFDHSEIETSKPKKKEVNKESDLVINNIMDSQKEISNTISSQKVSEELKSILDDVNSESDAKNKNKKEQHVDQDKLAKEWEASILSDTSNSQSAIDDIFDKPPEIKTKTKLNAPVELKTASIVTASEKTQNSNLKWFSKLTKNKDSKKPTPKILSAKPSSITATADLPVEVLDKTSLLSRYLNKRKSNKLKKIQTKKVKKALKNFRFEKQTSENNLTQDDALPDVVHTKVKDKTEKNAIVSKDTPVRNIANQTVYSKIRDLRKKQDEERSIEEIRVRKEQAENFKTINLRIEEEEKTKVVPFKIKVINSISQTVNFLIISAIITSLWYFIIDRKDTIVLKWPESAIVYKTFGFDVYAKGENIQLMPPTVSIVPINDYERRLQFRGTLKSAFSDRDQVIPNLFVLIKQIDGSIIDQWEIILDQNVLKPGQEIEYSDNRILPLNAKRLIIGFRIESLKLEEEYRFINKTISS